MSRRVSGLLLAAVLFALAVVAPAAAAADARLRSFLENHCLECHDSSAKKGGLDLDTLPMTMDDPEHFRLWERVHDRIAAGEMPPKPNEQPPAAGASSRTGRARVMLLRDTTLLDTGGLLVRGLAPIVSATMMPVCRDAESGGNPRFVRCRIPDNPSWMRQGRVATPS